MYKCIYIYTHYIKYDIHVYVYIYIYMVRRLAFPAPPPPPMVWSGTGGGGWRVLRGVRAVGAAAGETARRHRQGRHSTQALRKP